MDSNLVYGEFTDQEDEYLQANYQLKSDAQMAKELNRKVESIRSRRAKLGLKKDGRIMAPDAKKNRNAYISTLDDNERAEFLRKELRASATYKQIKSLLDADELEYYESKFVAFKMDPTIENMTVMEEDALHQMTMAQIRIFQYLKEELNNKTVKHFKAKEIRDCEETIAKCQESLNVQRRQRLKGRNEEALRFCEIIRELKDPLLRREAGYEAAMLKYMAEASYNKAVEDGCIISGKDPFDLRNNFKSGVVPSGSNYNFCGENE